MKLRHAISALTLSGALAFAGYKAGAPIIERYRSRHPAATVWVSTGQPPQPIGQGLVPSTQPIALNAPKTSFECNGWLIAEGIENLFAAGYSNLNYLTNVHEFSAVKAGVTRTFTYQNP